MEMRHLNYFGTENYCYIKFGNFTNIICSKCIKDEVTVEYLQ